MAAKKILQELYIYIYILDALHNGKQRRMQIQFLSKLIYVIVNAT